MKDTIYGIQIKYIVMIIIVVISLVAFYNTRNKLFILLAIISILFAEIYLTKCKTDYFYNPPLKNVNVELPVNSATVIPEKIQDESINNKIHRNLPSVLWQRNDAVKETYPFSINSEPPDSAGFARWCYGSEETCKSGGIYMNSPEFGNVDRTKCTGTN